MAKGMGYTAHNLETCLTSSLTKTLVLSKPDTSSIGPRWLNDRMKKGNHIAFVGYTVTNDNTILAFLLLHPSVDGCTSSVADAEKSCGSLGKWNIFGIVVPLKCERDTRRHIGLAGINTCLDITFKIHNTQDIVGSESVICVNKKEQIPRLCGVIPLGDHNGTCVIQIGFTEKLCIMKIIGQVLCLELHYDIHKGHCKPSVNLKLSGETQCHYGFSRQGAHLRRADSIGLFCRYLGQKSA